MAIEPEMHDPDWDRYLLTGGEMPPVGDPTRWGTQTLTRITGVGADRQSVQCLQAQTRDNYSRSWALLGTLSLPPDLWPSVPTVGIEISLEVAMGVGQAVVNHRIALIVGIPLGGLCYTQYFPNGGPYLAVPTPSLSENPAVTTDLTRAFAAVGGLVGQSINIRANYSINSAAVSLPARSQLNLIVTPFAAGEQL